eukprot:Gb_06101 [translate_table: standard]
MYGWAMHGAHRYGQSFSKVQISIPKFPGMASSAPASILYFLAILCSILFPSLVGIGHAARFASTSCYDKSGCPNYQAPIAAKDGGISISGNQYSHPPPPQVPSPNSKVGKLEAREMESWWRSCVGGVEDGATGYSWIRAGYRFGVQIAIAYWAWWMNGRVQPLWTFEIHILICFNLFLVIYVYNIISIGDNSLGSLQRMHVRDEERNSVANYSKQGLACPPQRSGRGNSPSPGTCAPPGSDQVKTALKKGSVSSTKDRKNRPKFDGIAGSKSASLPACRQPPCTLDNQEKIRGEGSNSVASNKQGIVCDPHRSNRGNFPSPSKCGPPASEEKNSALKTDWRANAKQENMDDGGGGLNQSQRHQAPWKKGKTITP